MTTDASRRSDHGATGSGQAPNPRIIGALKFAVVTMAILIVAGLAAVIWKIFGLANEAPMPRQAPAVSLPSAVPSELAGAITLALPAGASVRTLSLDGSRLAIHFEAPSGPGITILDLSTGHTLSRIELQRTN